MESFLSFFKDCANCKLSLAEGIIIGEKSEEGKQYIMVGERIYEINGSSEEILRLLMKNPDIKGTTFLSLLNEKFERFNEEESEEFLNFCLSKAIILKT